MRIDARAIRGAMANQADRDIRYFLNGIHFAANGDVVGTDGKTIYLCPTIADPEVIKQHEYAPGYGLIIQIDGKIPASVKWVEFDFTAKHCRTDKGKIYAIDQIDGKYPDYPRVIPQTYKGPQAGSLGFDASYLGRIEAAFGKGAAVEFMHGNEFEGAKIKRVPLHRGDIKDLNDLMVVMPMQL